MKMHRFQMAICFVLLFVTNPLWAQQRSLYLSFDRLDRSPVKVNMTVDEALPGTKLVLPESVRLAKGVDGLGIFLESPGDYCSISGSGTGMISGQEGAISFWLRSFWPTDDKRSKVLWNVEFEAGSFFLWAAPGNHSLTFVVPTKDGKEDYSSDAALDTAAWEVGSWHHIVVNWSAKTGQRQIFVDGKGYKTFDYAPPTGTAKAINISPTRKNAGSYFPACGIVDELSICQKPLSETEIAALYQAGIKRLGDFTPNSIVEMSLYPNLVAGASISWTPQPNFSNNNWTPNDTDDTRNAAKLADNRWHNAAYDNKEETLGWMASTVTIEFDLGQLKEIGSVGVNVGGGWSGVALPKKVSFYLGMDPANMTKAGEVELKESYPDPMRSVWHGRLIGLDALKTTARFVRIEIEPTTTPQGLSAVFLDEVFVVKRKAEPALTTVEVAAKPVK